MHFSPQAAVFKGFVGTAIVGGNPSILALTGRRMRVCLGLLVGQRNFGQSREMFGQTRYNDAVDCGVVRPFGSSQFSQAWVFGAWPLANAPVRMTRVFVPDAS
jgi:hypothetical protein